MRSRRRNLIVLVAVALFFAAIGLAVYLRKRAAPEPARLLADSDAVLYFNLKSVRRLTSFGAPPIGQHEPEYEEFVRETGFQFERDLNEAAFAVHTIQRPPASKGAPAVSELRYSEVFVGKFDGRRLANYLRKLSKGVERYHDTDIFSIPVEDRTVRVAFLSIDTVAASNLDDAGVIHGIIDRARSAAMPFAGPPLVADYYHKVPIGSLVWAIARIPAAPADPRAARAFTLPGGLDIFIPSQATMVASARYLGSIHARAEFFTASEGDAKRFVEQASTFLTLFKTIETGSQAGGNDPDVKEAFESLKIQQDDSRAILSATIPVGFFKKMLAEPPVDVTGTKQDEVQPPEQPALKESKPGKHKKK